VVQYSGEMINCF